MGSRELWEEDRLALGYQRLVTGFLVNVTREACGNYDLLAPLQIVTTTFICIQSKSHLVVVISM